MKPIVCNIIVNITEFTQENSFFILCPSKFKNNIAKDISLGVRGSHLDCMFSVR